MRPLFLLSVLAAALASHATVCQSGQAQSGSQRVSLLELYTSEGCSSCPPLDRWLSALPGRGLATQRLVPLAFHVDYWDYIGWRDRFASPRWTQRQYERVRQSGLRSAFTPQVVLNGRDVSANPDLGLRRALARTEVAPVSIALQLRALGSDLDVALQVQAVGTPQSGKVYLALYENGLGSQVQAGENQGVLLRHDAVVRALLGPWLLDQQGRLSRRDKLPTGDVLRIEQAGAVAWVENDEGVVLQTVALPCGV
ncbi:DUF1223 domain-containing protein [Chitinimonas sp.]|uniref:DUF1223 domain-containing protein n=1 Tax=Chitinimonas sp. TaxID=1934313 RepID=UPI0035B41ACE